jgi:imidazolonepropionase
MLKIFRNISQVATLKGVLEKDGRSLLPEDLSIIEHAACVFDHEKIIWVGKDQDLPGEYLNDSENTLNLSGQCLIPQLIDSHTHLVFAGNRANEFSMRLNGASYEEIASRGGGIQSTVNATRLADNEHLLSLARKRVHQMAKQGIGTIEIKSGYGLSYADEKRLNLIIDQLKQEFAPKITILNTFLAAHAIPAEFSSADEYLDQVVFPLLNEDDFRTKIDFVDIFVEENYFTIQQAHSLFKRCQRYGLPVKIHADELSDTNGAKIACEFKAISADHLICINQKNIELLAKSNTVATMLPGTSLFLGKPLAPAKKLAEVGARLAIASDYNPGSCNFNNLLQIASMGAVQYQLNTAQALSAITFNAAKALNIDLHGAIVPGYRPRFTRYQTDKIENLFYHWGAIEAIGVLD